MYSIGIGKTGEVNEQQTERSTPDAKNIGSTPSHKRTKLPPKFGKGITKSLPFNSVQNWKEAPKQLQTWLSNINVTGLRDKCAFWYRDCGGGGDCLFLSVATAILNLPENITLQICNDVVQLPGTQELAKELRLQAAASICEKEPLTFLNYVLLSLIHI